MFGKTITEYEKFSEGLEGYIVAFDLADLYAKSITGIQITDGAFTSDVLNVPVAINTLHNYINDASCPDIAYCMSSDIMYIFLKTITYPYSSATRFVVFGYRYPKPIESLDDTIDIKETEIELFINYALEEAALYQGLKADPVIRQNINLLESQLQG